MNRDLLIGRWLGIAGLLGLSFWPLTGPFYFDYYWLLRLVRHSHVLGRCIYSAVRCFAIAVLSRTESRHDDRPFAVWSRDKSTLLLTLDYHYSAVSFIAPVSKMHFLQNSFSQISIVSSTFNIVSFATLQNFTFSNFILQLHCFATRSRSNIYSFYNLSLPESLYFKDSLDWWIMLFTGYSAYLLVRENQGEPVWYFWP